MVDFLSLRFSELVDRHDVGIDLDGGTPERHQT
jgi:hypothetical protein